MNETELKKLTIPRLKFICKENNITGYSKLGKSYIIEKIVNWQRSQVVAPVNTLQLKLDTIIVNTDVSGLQPLTTDASTLRPSTSLVFPPVDPNPFIYASPGAITVSAAEKQDNHRSMTAIPLLMPPVDNEPQGDTTLTSLQVSRNGQNSSDLAKTEEILLKSRKRPLDAEEIFRSKKTRIDGFQPNTIVLTPALTPGLPERAKIMPLPVQVNYSKTDEAQSSDRLKKLQSPNISSFKAASPISTSKPFKALIPVASRNITKNHWQPLSTDGGSSDPLTNNRSPLVSSISADLDFSQEKDVELGPITLAPSILQRKRAPNLALVLSGISVQDLTACAQVSRLFRYSGKILFTFASYLVLTFS